MDEDKTKTQGAGTPTEPTNEDKKGGEGKSNDDKPTSFSQEDLDKVAAKVRAEEKAKAEKEKAKAIEDAKAEAERLAQLSAEEKEKELQERQSKELAEREKTLILRENKLEGIEKLNELKIPIKFIDFVLSDNKDTMNSSIETLHKEWTDAISAEVKAQLKGEAPKDPSSGKQSDEDSKPRTAFF